jgi:D-threo-aldose 1-dehydrogenase
LRALRSKEVVTEVSWSSLGVGVGVSSLQSRFWLGCAPLGNLFAPVSDDEAFSTLRAAWDAGVRAFDTAPHYGVGLSEERLGKFLAGRDRSEFVVSTKVGRRLIPFDGDASGVEGFYDTPPRTRVQDYSARGVRQSLEESCHRLGLEKVDVALIHDPDDVEHIALHETYPALAELRDQGLVSAIGVGMNQVPMLERFVRETAIDCVLVAGRYSLLNSDVGDSFFQLCDERGVAVLVGGVFNSGVLADASAQSTYNYRPVEPALLARVRAIRAVCERYDVSLPAAAMQYVLRSASVAGVVIGVRSADEVRDDITYFRASVPDELFHELRERRLINANVGAS